MYAKNRNLKKNLTLKGLKTTISEKVVVLNERKNNDVYKQLFLNFFSKLFFYLNTSIS